MKARENLPKIRKLPSSCITISIPSTMLADVDAISATTGEKRSRIIQKLIQSGFAHKKIMLAEKEWTPDTKLEIAKKAYLEAMEEATLEYTTHNQKRLKNVFGR